MWYYRCPGEDIERKASELRTAIAVCGEWELLHDMRDFLGDLRRYSCWSDPLFHRFVDSTILDALAEVGIRPSKRHNFGDLVEMFDLGWKVQRWI